MLTKYAITEVRMKDQTKRRNEILDAALHLVAERGIRNLTVRRLSQAMRITDAALYYYFQDKLAIIQALVSRFEGEADAVGGELSEIKETPETCVAYHRDMGEDYRAPFTFETVDEYQYRGKGRLAAEYPYLFDDGKWSVYEPYGISEWCDFNVVLENTNSKED